MKRHTAAVMETRSTAMETRSGLRKASMQDGQHVQGKTRHCKKIAEKEMPKEQALTLKEKQRTGELAFNVY